MQVLVSSKNFVVTEAIRIFAQEQADKLGRLSEKIIKVRLYLESVEKKNNDPLANRAQVVVEIPGADITVEKHAVEMYEAVLKAFDVAHRHVRKHHEKMKTKRRKAKQQEEEALD